MSQGEKSEVPQSARGLDDTVWEPRPNEKRWKYMIQVMWPLAGHFTISIALSVCMILLLDGYMALDGAVNIRMSISTYRLRASDISTIISVVLVLVKLTVGSWAAVSLWRCVYILMEQQDGLKLSEIGSIMSWPHQHWPKAGRLKGSTGWSVTITLMLIFPQAYIAPIITGAVDWQQAVQLDFKNLQTISFSQRPTGSSYALKHQWFSESFDMNDTWVVEVLNGLDWASYQIPSDVERRRLAVYRLATGLAAAMWKTSDFQGNGGSFDRCRHWVASDSGVAPGSVLLDAELPAIEITRIGWQSERQKLIFKHEYWADRVNRTMLTIGQAVLFDVEQKIWFNALPEYNSPNIDFLSPTSKDEAQARLRFPSPTVFSGEKTLLMILDEFRDQFEITPNTTDYLDSMAIRPANCAAKAEHSVWGDSFSRVPEDIYMQTGGIWQSVERGNKVISRKPCFAQASVQLTAGVKRFRTSKFLSTNLVEGLESENEDDQTIYPDKWTLQALDLLPSVMYDVSTLNTSGVPSWTLPTWNNLDGYIEALIRVSYMASWEALRHSLEPPPAERNKVILAHPRLQAKVSHVRVFVWLGISLLMEVSGMVWYLGAQRSAQRPVIIDQYASALFTDPAEMVVGTGKQDLTGLKFVTKWDKKHVGNVGLSRETETGPWQLKAVERA
ncbi:hypothetical protein DFH27DRAFT_225242 [Peziza echinospora]|nr:hypothetical protein DFH27DRAFT_225242 [Peziza echinospora]